MQVSIQALYEKQIDLAVRHALAEDFSDQDITSTLCVDPHLKGEASIIAKQSGIFFGKDIFWAILDQKKLKGYCIKDGEAFEKGQVIATVEGSVLNIMQVERSVLNFLQRLSGVSTYTQQFVKALEDPKISICDTRKTCPGMRYIEKAAVLAGGARNHRFNLSDQVLIKENHLDALVGNLADKLTQFKQENPEIQVQIEARDLKELYNLPIENVDMFLLDNFKLSHLDEAIEYLEQQKYSGLIEVSGNITLRNIARYQGKNIHRISVGALTHSAPCIDLSLLIQKIN